MAVSISLSITQNSQSIANNTSSVTVKVIAKWTGGSYNHVVDASGTAQAKGWVKIDGTSYNFNSTFNDNRTTSGSKTICTKTVTISHATNGTKTLYCSASYATGVNSGTVTASASKVLTTIPRKSTLSVANGTLGTSQTIAVTRQATSFTHSIKAVCGNSTLYIKADGTTQSSEVKHSDCSIQFTPPISWASQNTAGTSVSVKYTITTYSGSTNVGYNTYSKTCTIPSTVKPSCTVTVTDPTGIYDIYNAFVEGLSKFKVTVTPTIAYNSAIKAYKTTANGSTYTAASFTTGLLSSSGTLKVSTTVTDKRGRSGSASVSKTVLAYNPPTINMLSVKRCNEDGTSNDQGEYVQITFSASVTSLNSKNTAAYLLKYKQTSEDTYTEIVFSDYAGSYSVSEATYVIPADSSKSYDIELDVSDSHNTTKRATTASTGFTLMHFGVTGDCIGLGKVSELNGVLDIGLQTRFYGGILHPELEPETDLNDIRTPNTYVGANVTTYNYANCPLTSGTFTLEVVGMGEAGQVKQRLTYCHKTASRAWERIYYSSGWGEWVCVSDFDGQLLASPGMYMTSGHTVDLAEPISKQRSGIVLVFSEYYDSQVANSSFHCRFIPKLMVSTHSGSAQCIQLSTSNLAYFATKYLYITDTKITGHDNNGKTGTGTCGITYTNNRFVLRYVIGV